MKKLIIIISVALILAAILVLYKALDTNKYKEMGATDEWFNSDEEYIGNNKFAKAIIEYRIKKMEEYVRRGGEPREPVPFRITEIEEPNEKELLFLGYSKKWLRERFPEEYKAYIVDVESKNGFPTAYLMIETKSSLQVYTTFLPGH